MGIYETVQLLENLRKKRNLLNTIMLACLGAMFLIPMISPAFVMSMSVNNTAIVFMYPFIMIAVILVIGNISSKYTKEYKKIYKDTFVTGALNELFDNVEYYWERGFLKEEVRKMGLVANGNRFSSEDYISATYNNIRFQQADVTIKNETGSGKNRRTVLYFKGRMFAFEFPMKSVLSVKVYSERFNYRARHNDGFKLHKIDMESSDFNKKFDVLTYNDHDSFYLITPQVMERISNLKNRFGDLSMHFQGNKLYVGINMSGDAFDGNIKRKVTYLDEKEAIKNDSQVIIDIIDMLGIIKADEPEEIIEETFGTPQYVESKYGFELSDSNETIEDFAPEADGYDIANQTNSKFKLKR